MNWLIIILSSVVIGLLYRATTLYIHIHKAYEYAVKYNAKTDAERGAINASAGCITILCGPCLIWVILPVYLFIVAKWWIPVTSLAMGLTIIRGLGYMLERLFALPDHDALYQSDLDLNAMEYTVDNRQYRRALGLLSFYIIISVILTIIIVVKTV